MASNFQKFLASAEKHAVAGSSKLLATNGGKHVYSVKLTEDLDNGVILTLGDYSAEDYFAQGTDAAVFAGKICGKAPNGNFYVRVTNVDDNTVLLLTSPLEYEQYTQKLQEDSQFYNAADSIGRAYGLGINDIFELSLEGFDGTPEVGKEVSVNATTHKLTVA